MMGHPVFPLIFHGYQNPLSHHTFLQRDFMFINLYSDPLRHRQEPRPDRLPAHLRRRPQRPRVLHLPILRDQPLRDGQGT